MRNKIFYPFSGYGSDPRAGQKKRLLILLRILGVVLLFALVSPQNAQAAAVDDSYITTGGVPVSDDVLTNDTGNPGTQFLSWTSTPGNGTFSYSGSTFTYTPNVGYVGTETFTYSMQYERRAGRWRTDTGTVTVVVQEPPTTPPIANADVATTDRHTAVNIDVLFNDTDPDGDGAIDPTTLAVTSQPAHGTAVVSGGQITYMPETPFDPANLAPNTDTFTYTVNDLNGMTSNAATVTVTVTAGSNADPVAYDKTFETPEDVPLTAGNLITADNAVSGTPDGDPDGDLLQVDTSVPATPSQGSVTLHADGSFEYTPNAGASGFDTFDYTVIDGYGGSATATVTINLIPPQADLSVVKTGPSLPVKTQTTYAYTLHVSSAGGTAYVDADGVRVVDALPSGVNYVSSGGTGWSCSFDLGSGHVICDKATALSPGTSAADITIEVQAPSVEGNVSNSATVSSAVDDPDLGNNTGTAVTEVVGIRADLSLTKSGPSSDVVATDQYSYTLSVRNNGEDDASGINVFDTLPADVLFVSATDSADWSCAQPSGTSRIVPCEYIGNGGVLAANTTAPSITITVTAPVTPMSVTNNARVEADTFDPDGSNNSDSATTNIVEGTGGGTGSRPLTKYLQYNVFGDMKMIGNTVMWKSATETATGSCGTSGEPLCRNNEYTMRAVDIDGDATTFNSSSADLALGDPGYEIVWAGLYWQNHLCYENTTNNVCQNSYMGYNVNNANQFDSMCDDAKYVKFKAPGGSYVNVTANFTDYDPYSTYHRLYSSFADVTALMNGQGTYTVADIRASEGRIQRDMGGYGGWALLVIYQDPTGTMQYKNVSVFNGFVFVKSNLAATVDIDGFVTPDSPPITSSVAFFAADGDKWSSTPGRYDSLNVGDAVQIAYQGDTSDMRYISDAQNPVSPYKNLFNSSISELGVTVTAKNPNYTDNLGVDIDRIDVSSFMTTGQSSTRFYMETANPGDVYLISVMAFATRMFSPVINNFNKDAVILDANGSTYPSGPGVIINPGAELTYTLTFENTGDEIATDVEIFDDFDFDGLTDYLDLTNFDISSIILTQPNSSTPQSNPDCGYDSGENRVWCHLTQADPGDVYKMYFTVAVKSTLTNTEDVNITNTAYANYKNSTTGANIYLISTPYGEFGGSSNTHNAGTIAAGGGGGDIFYASGMDAINPTYAYGSDRNITTKIVNSAFSLKLVHLDDFGVPAVYTGDYEMPVVLTLCKNDSVHLTGDNVAPTFPAMGMQGAPVSEIIADNLVTPLAHEDDRIGIHFIDWSQVMEWPTSPPNCVQRSTVSGNYMGIPQCLSSETHVDNLFPYETYPHVHDVCLGHDLNLTGNQVPPCSTNAYSGGQLNNAKVIMPAKYQNRYGCLQCLSDAGLEFHTCSSDNFAARPELFTMDSAEPHYPDLLRSAHEYNMTVYALDGTGSNTLEYNQTSSGLDVNQTLYYHTGAVAPTGALHGTLQFGSNAFYFVDGLSTAPSGNNNVADITFDDVAKVGVRLIDSDWARVDDDDTPQDCDNIPDASGIVGAYVCGDQNVTFIPHHFTLAPLVITNNNGNPGTFTYLANLVDGDESTYVMAARLETTITAQNELDGTTENFIFGDLYYENPLSVTQSIHDVERNKDANTTSITDVMLGFGTNGDANGTKLMNWDETNLTKVLRFNFERVGNVAVNPFMVTGPETNVTATSTYTQNYPGHDTTAEIRGEAYGTADQNATFIYGRAHAPRFRVPCDVNGTAPCATDVNRPVKIYYEFYYSKPGTFSIDANNTMLLSTAQGGTLTNDNNRSTDAINWFINTQHTASDGNITALRHKFINYELTTTTAPLRRTGIIGLPANGISEVGMGYNGSQGYAYKSTIEIHTQEWLLYNRFEANPVYNEFELEFNNKSGAETGTDTSNVGVDSDANVNTSRRIQW